MMNQPSDFTTDKAVYGYLPLMHELAERIELVAAVGEGRNTAFAKTYAREFTYLQFRRMCVELHPMLPHV